MDLGEITDAQQNEIASEAILFHTECKLIPTRKFAHPGWLVSDILSDRPISLEIKSKKKACLDFRNMDLYQPGFPNRAWP